MGKGDKRSKRGKIWRGTNGKTRLKPSKAAKVKAAVAAEPVKKVVKAAPKKEVKPAAAPKKAPAKKPA